MSPLPAASSPAPIPASTSTAGAPDGDCDCDSGFLGDLPVLDQVLQPPPTAQGAPGPNGPLTRDQVQARVQQAIAQREQRQREALRAEIQAELEPALRAGLTEQVRHEVREEIRTQVIAHLRAEIRAELLAELEPQCRAQATALAQAEAEAQQQARWQQWLRDDLPAIVQQQTHAGQRQWVECISRGVLQHAPQWAEAIHHRLLSDLQQHLNQNLPPLQASARTQWGQAMQAALLLPEGQAAPLAPAKSDPA